MICDICGRSNKRTKYFEEHNSILCDSCLGMVKKHPVIYIPPKGEIHYDKDGNILCHVCGRSFKKLTEHIKSKHKLTTDEYKRQFGLNRTAKLTGKNFIANITVDVTTVSNNTRFEKGHTLTKGKNKTKRLQTIKNRTGMKYNKGVVIMGEVAEMILLGILCEQCGCVIDGEEVGYPRLCECCEF